MVPTHTTLSRLRVPLLLAVLAAAAPLHAQEPSGSGFYQDFRGGRRPQPPLELFRDDGLFGKAEDQGWRITVPAGQPKITNIGLVMKGPVKGDFELTAGYEILQADRPRGRSPAGFEFYIRTETPTNESIGFSRWAHRNEGEVYTCSRMTTGPDGRGRSNRHQHIPAQSRSGSLRLTRAGSEVTFWADEGTGHFHKLWRYDLGPEDLTLLRLTAYACPDHTPVDVRIVDLRVRAEMVSLDSVDSATSIPPKRSMTLVLLLLGLFSLLFLLVCAWVRLRTRRRAEKKPAATPPRARPASGS